VNFDKAFKELIAGKSIRRKKWCDLMCIRKIEDDLKTFKGESLHLYSNSSLLLSDGWLIVDSDGTKMPFVEALNALKLNKKITHENMNGGYIFIDNGSFAKCVAVEYDFMPTYEDICSNDWELIK